MNLSEAARAICPYYKKYKDREIQCEGCVKRARLVFAFRSKSEALAYKRGVCDTYGWCMCAYARMKEMEWSEGEVNGAEV